ncbi:BTB/POZ domain-containing protein [Ditylenchus destructor]|nr:BTB/POZ domain-containing protein [Ditylenchus destructor]
MGGINSAANSNWVRFNVGGKTFRTTKDTLSRHPESFLARLVSGDLQSEKDKSGAYLIDRNPEHFENILTYLRSGILNLDDNQKTSKDLLCEADFYNIEPLVNEIRKAMRTPNIAAMDNGTIVETFKFLNYYQLATSGLVSKRFWNQIRTHRHKLALLYVNRICMSNGFANQDPVIKMFNEELSPEKYNEWIVRNGYSKQIPLEGQISGKESTENVRDVFEMIAVSQNQKQCHEIATAVFYARVELKDETWPLFQHFIRLIMDPLLAGAMNPDRNRLQCKQLNIYFNGDTQKFIVWIKDHVRCDEFVIYGDGNSNYDEEMFDLFQTGAPCTSAIYVRNYYPSKVIVDLLKKFVGLKNGDEYQLVESTFGDVKDRESIENLKRNFAEFIAEEEQYEENLCTLQVIRFINNDIGKKLTLCVRNFSYGIPSSFSIIITSL